jgi:hypothetical protein
MRMEAHTSRRRRDEDVMTKHEVRRHRKLWSLNICIGCIGLFAFGGIVLQAGSASAIPPRWSVTPSPSVPGATETYLNGVSCTNSSSCVAVGYDYNGSSYETLAESWDGAAWSVVPSPSPSTGYNYLYSVSCTSSSYCVAVGAYSDPPSGLQTLVEVWNGAEWSVVLSPNATNADNSLGSVSCVDPTHCVAVGGFDGGALANQTLVESWNGSAWSIVSSPNPGTEADILSGVSCTSRACTAVGYSIDLPGRINPRSPPKTLVESWDGTEWSVVHSAHPHPLSGGQLQSVSCTSATWCEAVGSGPIGALIENLSASRWKAIPSHGVALGGVSCVNSRDCVAVGSARRRTVVDGWDGSVVVHVPSPHPGQKNDLSAVSCTSATDCVAVGDATTAGGKSSPLIETGHR